MVGGAPITDDEQPDTDIAFLNGAVPARSTATSAARHQDARRPALDRHSDNAERVVEYLAGHSKIEKVLYPGLADHPGHAVAAKQMSHYGGMVSVLVNGGLEAAQDFCARTEVFTLAESRSAASSR